MTLHLVLRPDYIYHNYLEQFPSLDFLNDFDLDTGAVGINRKWVITGQGNVSIRAQEIGELLICKGLATNDAIDLESGLKVLSFGVNLQSIDGSFPDEHPGFATAFFLCATAVSLLMLRESESPEYEYISRNWLSLLLKSAKYLGGHEPEHTELSNIICAAAAGVSLLSVIEPASEVRDIAVRMCEVAISLQRSDGSWPEYKGTDTMYQAVSLIYSTYAFLSCTDKRMRRYLEEALEKGFYWLAQRIGTNGEVQCYGNTRKTYDEYPPDKPIYISDLINVDYAFRMWGTITDDTRWNAIADTVRGWIKRSNKSSERSTWDVITTGIV